MKDNKKRSIKGASNISLRVFIFFILFLLLLAVSLTCREKSSYDETSELLSEDINNVSNLAAQPKQISHPDSITQLKSQNQPPDLSVCTHLEINYYPSNIEYIQNLIDGLDLMSPSEMEYLKSLEKIVIDDEKVIQDINRFLNKGVYRADLDGARFLTIPPVNVICFHDDDILTYITPFGYDLIRFGGGKYFEYDTNFPNLLLLVPKTRPLALRIYCGRHMQILKKHFISFFQIAQTYPESTEWCDIIIQKMPIIKTSDIGIMTLLKCPGQDEGKCHYAMNPNCEPNSPPDMVLLFETKTGWNQHGGPELFTFDNHNPKGGCVLLNDGTVKFIRTEDELKALRWK
jgi:hypothetical protein